jgi:predicted aminopeptidase
LAHQKLYIKDDSNFNEAFATTVARMGVIKWLQSENKHVVLQKYLQSNQHKQQIYQILEVLRNDLTEIYNASLPVAQKRKQKQAVLTQYKHEVTNKTESWGQYDLYKNWLLQDMNNARLNALSTYQALVPAFITLFEHCNNNFNEFYRVVESMQQLSKPQRLVHLQSADCG